MENSENFSNFTIWKIRNSIKFEVYKLSYIVTLPKIKANIKIKNKFENKKIQ